MVMGCMHLVSVGGRRGIGEREIVNMAEEWG